MPVEPAGGREGGGVSPECPRPHDMLRWQYWHHLCAKVQPHAPRLLDAACTQAFYGKEDSLAGGSKCGDPARRDG